MPGVRSLLKRVLRMYSVVLPMPFDAIVICLVSILQSRIFSVPFAHSFTHVCDLFSRVALNLLRSLIQL